MKIVIFEKESEAGLHASGRNSGVLHAGFYYSPDSLKAKFCRDGNKLLRNYITKNSLPLLKTGKVVVTQNSDEENQLNKLFERGVKNGVDLELLTAKDLNRFEPLAKTYSNFLWSPTTAVSDPKILTQTLVSELKKLGVCFVFSCQITNFAARSLSVNQDRITFKHLINAAGTQSDRIAHKYGFGLNYSMLPFIGLYRYVKRSKLPLSTLVYPVPHPVNPFLGVHFTLTHNDLIKIGPTAIPIFGREQYQLFSKVEMKDISDSFVALKSLISGKTHNVSGIIRSELPKYSTVRLLHDAKKLVPEVHKVKGWRPKSPGIRAQLVNLNSGDLVQDYIVEHDKNSTHILNAVSPGWTSAFSFALYIADQVVEAL